MAVYAGISQRDGRSRKRLLQAVLALALALWPVSPAAGANPSTAGRPFAASLAVGEAGAERNRESHLAYGTTFPARVLRKDRLILGPETRICVATTIDPEARRIVEGSGQSFDPDAAAEGLTHSTTVRLSSEFRDRGWSSYKPRNRILPYIEHELNPRGCFDRSDTILVRQSVVRGKSRVGYAVRLKATQGRRVYEVAVERPYAVKVSDEIRVVIAYRSDKVPGTQQPYWDPRHDSARLSDMFIHHLLEGAGK